MVWNSHCAQDPPSRCGWHHQKLGRLFYPFAMACMYPMDISMVDEGQHITVVVQILVFDPSHESHMVCLQHSGVTCRFTGLIEGGFSNYTICDAVMGKQFPMPVISCDASTRILNHAAPSWVNMRKMIDGCSGLGGIAHGAQALGISTTVSIDLNSRMTELHQRHSDSAVIVGDLGDLEVIKQVGAQADGAKILCSGFNCQPFSSLGDGLGGKDPRAQSLPKTLKAAYYLQARVVLLECVTPAKDDGFVSQAIDHFLKVTGFRREIVDLHLHDVWPCRRSRTWWMLYDPFLGDLGVHSWPRLLDVPAVKCLIPYISRWDPRDELALALDATECCAFGVEDGTFARYLLSSEGVSPTALHAWGSQLRACPCGCRHAALSDRRLAEKGLFGLLVQSRSDVVSGAGVRHVHPNEALALNGMDSTIDFGLDVRLTLSGIGQIASPLQAAWMLSFFIAKLEALCHGSCSFSPESQLYAFRAWLIMRCQLTWPCTDCTIPDVKMRELVSFWHEYSHLSLAEIVQPSNWTELNDLDLTVASVLDHIIRSCCKPDPRWVLPSVDEPETPWIEEVTCDPKCDFALHVGVSMISLIEPDGNCCEFGFVAGSTIADFLEAHGKLHGAFRVASISDGLGMFVTPGTIIERGQQIQVFLAQGSTGTVYPAECAFAMALTPGEPGLEMTHASVEPSDVLPANVDGLSMPRESGPLPIMPDDQQQCLGAFDTMIDPSGTPGDPPSGSVNVLASGFGCLGTASALLALTEQQFLRLTMPCVESMHKLTTLRSQMLTANDRLKLLDVQQCLWSDDEVSFHLQQLISHCALPARAEASFPLPVVVDPILMSAWLNGCGLPISQWVEVHPDILATKMQVIGVGCVHGHWIPFQLVPCGTHANIFTWDSPKQDHGRLNRVLAELSQRIGFHSHLITREQRMFFDSGRCGALAIHFLHNVLHGTMLPISADEAQTVHDSLRSKFAAEVAQNAFVVRPWIWGNGDNEDDSFSLVNDAESDQGECRLLPRLPTQSHALPLLPVGNHDDPTCIDGDEDMISLPRSWDWEIVSSLLGISPFAADPRELGPFDIGVCPPSCFPFVMSSEMTSLVQMDVQQLQALPCPRVPDPFVLWGVRHQMMLPGDRLNMLMIQYGVWADDEIRFQLQIIRTNCLTQTPEQRILILDPLVITLWLDPMSCSCESWARMHPEVLHETITIISAVCIDHHWVPVILVPEGSKVCIVTSDLPQFVPPRLINVLHRVSVALGFAEISFDHEARGFQCRSVCGAIAIGFIQQQLLGTPNAVTYAAAWGMHASFRHQFVQMLQLAERVPRPWLWASGHDTQSEPSEHSWPSGSEAGDPGASSSAQPLPTVGGPRQMQSSHVCVSVDDRINLFQVHGTAMGDDEIRFHLQDLQTRKIQEIASQPGHIPGVACFESLNFLQWDDVGHILTEKWCQGFPQVKEFGYHVIGVVPEGEHWLPIWLVPAGMVLVAHTFDDVLDYDIFDGKIRWIALHLGFHEVTIHRVPNGLPSHSMCGAHSIAFLEHILLGTPLPETVEELDLMRVHMRASFVQAMHEDVVSMSHHLGTWRNWCPREVSE